MVKALLAIVFITAFLLLLPAFGIEQTAWDLQPDGTYLPSDKLLEAVRENPERFPHFFDDAVTVSGKSYDEIRAMVENKDNKEWYLIASAFGGLLFLTSIVEWFEKRKYAKVVRYIYIAILICSLYCLYTGLNLIVDWSDTTANINSNEFAGKRRAGIVLFVIKFWPYILIITGTLSGWSSFKMLRK